MLIYSFNMDWYWWVLVWDEYAIVDWQSLNLMRIKYTKIDALLYVSYESLTPKLKTSICILYSFLAPPSCGTYSGPKVIADMAEGEPSICQSITANQSWRFVSGLKSFQWSVCALSKWPIYPWFRKSNLISLTTLLVKPGLMIG